MLQTIFHPYIRALTTTMDFERIRHILGKAYLEQISNMNACRARMANMQVTDRGVLDALRMSEQQCAGAASMLKRVYSKIFGLAITDYGKKPDPVDEAEE